MRELLDPHRAALALVTVIIVAISIISLAQPFLLRTTIDRAIPEGNVPLLVASVLGMIGVAVLTQVLGVYQTWTSTRVATTLTHRLRLGVFERLQDQSLGFYTRTRRGDITSRMLNDVAAMRSVITDVATGIASNLTTTIATAAAMLALSWRLSLLSLIVIPPCSVGDEASVPGAPGPPWAPTSCNG